MLQGECLDMESNPRIQCSVCGQWKRLTRTNGPDAGMQTFYPCCGDNGQYEHAKPVCYECCKKNCPYKPKENELPTLQQAYQRIDGASGTTKVSQAPAQVQEKSKQGDNEG